MDISYKKFFLTESQLSESPDEIRIGNEIEAHWDDDDAMAFVIIDDKVSLCSTGGDQSGAANHPAMSQCLLHVERLRKMAESNEASSEAGDNVAIQLLEEYHDDSELKILGVSVVDFYNHYYDDVLDALKNKEAVHYKASGDASFALRDMGIAGRVWTEKKMISFWTKQTEVRAKLKWVASFIHHAGIGNVKEYQFNFTGDKGLKPYNAVVEPIDNEHKPKVSADYVDKVRTTVGQISALRGLREGNVKLVDLLESKEPSYQGNCVHILDNSSLFNDATEMAYVDENAIQISKEEFLSKVKDVGMLLSLKNKQFYNFEDKIFFIYDSKNDIHYFYA